MNSSNISALSSNRNKNYKSIPANATQYNQNVKNHVNVSLNDINYNSQIPQPTNNYQFNNQTVSNTSPRLLLSSPLTNNVIKQHPSTLGYTPTPRGVGLINGTHNHQNNTNPHHNLITNNNNNNSTSTPTIDIMSNNKDSDVLNKKKQQQQHNHPHQQNILSANNSLTAGLASTGANQAIHSNNNNNHHQLLQHQQKQIPTSYFHLNSNTQSHQSHLPVAFSNSTTNINNNNNTHSSRKRYSPLNTVNNNNSSDDNKNLIINNQLLNSNSNNRILLNKYTNNNIPISSVSSSNLNLSPNTASNVTNVSYPSNANNINLKKTNSLRHTAQQLRSPLIPNYHNFNQNNPTTNDIYSSSNNTNNINYNNKQQHHHQNYIINNNNNNNNQISPTSSLTSASGSSSASSTSSSPSLNNNINNNQNNLIKKKAIQQIQPVTALTTASIISAGQLNPSNINNNSSPNLILNNNNNNKYNPIILSSPKIHSNGNLNNKTASQRSPNQTPRSRSKSKSNHLKSPQNSSLNIKDDLPFDPASLLLLASSSSFSSLQPSTHKIQLNNNNKIEPVVTTSNKTINNTNNSTNSLKATLENIELKMRIIASPNIRIADLFKCFLKNVPKSTETIESLVHYGDNIGAKVVKCLINESLYESQSLINQDYDIYQGPALCVTYDSILKEEHWDEIFICNEDECTNGNSSTTKQNGNSSTNKSKPFMSKSASPSTSASSTPNGAASSNSSSSSHQQNASKFISFFHISDFIAILSGYKVAFVDPYERFAPDERSYVAIFDLEHDTHDIEQFEDQFKPLEKIFNVPLLKNRYYNGTIIRLPLRTQTSNCSVSSKLVHVKDILMNAKDFMKEAHLHILFSKNISNIQFCRTKDSQNIEKIYSINVEDSCMEQFRQKYKKINDAILDGDFPRTSTIIITLRKQIETKIEKTEWILSIFADTMRLLNSNYFLMKLAIPISDNCDKDIRFSHKSNLISSDTGFIKTLFLSKPIICYIEDKEGILMSHFCRLNISDSLKLSHFNDAYALMLKDLTKLIRKEPTLLWSLMPDLDKNTEFAELLGEIWQEIAKHELFYSCTEGWGYVAIEDMIINDVEDQSILQEILTKVYSETNYPVVIMPHHVLKALQKHSPKDSLQIMTPSQTSDILHNNLNLIEQLKTEQRIELLKYLIKEPIQQNQQTVNLPITNGNPPITTVSTNLSSNSNWASAAARYILDLPLLLLSNQKFIKFQAPNKVKTVYLVEKEYMCLFNSDTMESSQFINPDLPKDLFQVLKKIEFQRLTQAQMISDNELNELISVPKEWRNGDDKIQWPKFHDKFNLEWLETLWKYLGEYCKNDLSMMENFNIIYAVQSVNSIINRKLNKTKDITPVIDNSKNLTLFKLSKNSNLVYTPIYSSIDNENGKTASTSATTTDLNNKTETLNVLSEETYTSLIKILTKLGFECIDSISNTILAHPLFHNYVPNLRTCRYNLLKAFRNKYKNAPMFKLNQDFNAYLNDVDIKLLQQFLSKLEISSSSSTTSNQANCGFNSNSLPSFINNNNLNNKQSIPSVNIKEVEEEQSLIDMFKDLPIFENSAFECKERYLSLKDALFIYETPIRLPFELPGIKPFIIVQDNESKLLIIEKLNLKLVKDFSFIIKEIVKYCTSKELNSLPPIKVHSIGKWLLLNCASYLLANFNSNDTNNSNKTNNINNSKSSSDLIELIKSAKLFFNQNNELCAAYQFINPMFKERFIPILETKCLPAKDLMEEKCISILKELKMRNCLQLKVDEIIDLYENSVKQTDINRRLLAELIIEILINRLQDSKSNSLDSTTSIEKVLNEYSASKAVTLRHFLMSVSWIPLQRERPQSYPQSLSWKGSESLTTNGSGISTSTLISAASTSIKFSSPRECVDSAFAYCVGSVACVSDLEIPIDLKSYIDLKQVHLDTVVRHLKLTTKCFESSALKVEWYDYLTVSKRCYEFMSTCDPQDIIRELKANDLNEWIWNGAGFSSISSIFIITEKDHPLCSHVAVLPFELYVFVKFFERLGIKKQPDSKQLEQILNKCVKNSQKLMMLSSTAPVAAASTAIKSPLSPVSTSDQNQMFLENAAKNFPLINWIKAYYSTEKKLQAIIKDYEENLINVNSSLGTNGTIHTNGTTSSAPFITSANGQSPTSKSPVSDPKFINSDNITGVENSSDYIFLYLPETYKSPEIKDNLLNSVLTLVKNKQIKILDEEAYLMRKVAVAAAASVAAAAATTASSSISSSTSSPTTSIQNPLSSGVSKNQIYNIFDHYRVYNEIILPNLNSLSKNVKDAVVLFALDHADPKMLEILRDHPCIPVLPYGRRLKKPNKLVHPMGKIAPLYLDSDERFPCGSEETYLREDRLQILKILGMRCDSLNWLELIERAESISKIREYDLAIERSIVILSILNEKLANSNILLNVNGQSNNQQLNGSATPQHIETKEEKESRFNACELIRDISFIPVKTKPYQKLNLTWYGDKFKLRFAKPRELLSGTYENLCSCFWPIPLYEYKRKEKIITKQIEQFFGIDDLMSKFTLRDALNQLEEVCKINLQEIDDSKEVKLITDMCFQIYEYIQSECQKRPAELIPVVREFFSEKKCILLNEEFISVNQLCWHLSVNLKSMFYQIPTAFLRSLKYLFNQVLNVRVNLDLPDLLHVVDSMKKKYKDTPVVNRDDFNMLMNVYGLMIDQGYQIITNLYLPNINGILLPGRVLFFHPLVADHLDKPEEYVHPAVDRRICIIAGCLMNKKLNNQENGVSLNGVQPQIIQQQQNNQSSSSFSNGRIFPRVFGNKRLEGILARLDDDKIDPNLVNSIDEGNPQIIIDYLLEANRIHSLSAFLSEDDIFVILKYFNDFLARNYQAGTFQRLKELKIYKPLWCDKYISLSSIHIPSSSPNIFSAPGINVLPLNPQQQQVPNVFLISDEMSSLMKRSFKLNPFVQKLQSTSDLNSNVPCTILVRRQELHKLYTHLSLINLNDLDAFISLCLPQFRKIDAKCQNNFLKYLYEEIMEKSYIHEKEKCFKVLREKLYLQTRKGDQQLICDLYDMKNETLKNILNDSFFPDESFDSPQCLRFLKEAGLRTHLPSDLCKKCMNEIEMKVTGENSNAEQQQNSSTTSTTTSGWTDELRTRSKWLYQHLIENWQRFDDSVLQQRFLEPYCSAKQYIDLKQPFEYNEFNKTCLKLSDAELQKYELLVWSSSYILPSFVKTETMESNAIEFLKLNRKPCFAIVNQHLNNICESVGSKTFIAAMSGIPDLSENIATQDETLIEILGKIYQYLDDLHSSEHHKDMYKQLEDKEIVWSSSTRKFISPNKICIQLDIADEIPPFLYSLTPSLKTFRNLLLRLGAKDKPYPMLYGDILRKMAKVCGDDYLNSNELCKAIKAMECFFKYLKLNNLKTDSNDLNSNGPNTENVTAQFKLPGLYFVTTELKLEKSSNCVILDNRDNLDDLAKLPQDKFVFNPSEKVFKISTNEIKPLIDKIFISQRPTLFSQKYEATYDFTLPDDPDSQRQNLLTSLERKYQQIFTSRQLHRCLARCISNEEARRSSPKHLPIDEVEKVIRERLSSIKVTCVEYLETSLSYRKLSQQQKLEQTVEEKACYLTHESLQFATLYVSKKHIEQPYFALCLARALQPLLIDLHFDHSIFTSLIATSVSQMSRLLQLVNVATEENILSVIKLQYVPSSGKLYGDDVNLLAPYDPKLHNVLIGDLCVFANSDGTYIYCQIVKINVIHSKSSKYTSSFKTETKTDNFDYEFTVQIDDNGTQLVKILQKDLYVLENWHRIYDAMTAKPPDERETFKYQESSSSSTKNNNSTSNNNNDNDSNGKRETNEDNNSGNASDSSDKSDTSSNYGSSEQLPNAVELEQAKSEINQELRLLWSLEENERKKKINRLLLKWHPDKNPGKEKFASEVFKHLKKQIEFYKTDPFMAGFYRSTYSSYGGFNPSSTTNNSTYGTGSTTGTEDYKSKHYGSFDDLHRKSGSPGGSGSPHSSPSRESGPTGSSFDYDAKGPGPSNLGRTGSFRQEWERRRQQKRQTTGTDPRDRSSPSSARRRGTDFTQMDASLWFTQAKCDLDSANNDMHPITGKPAYEWVCYKCYRAVEKALRAYHYFKGNGKLPASDIHGLLLGVETNIRDIAFRFCNFIGNEANSMQYPGIARFGKTPNEVFPLTKAEQALDYGKELLKLVEDIIYAN